MKVLLTGANGQLGCAIKRQIELEKDKFELIQTNGDVLDITNLKDIKNWLLKVKPNIVINCAAYTDVDGCEDNVLLAYRVNALGPKYLAEICEEIGAKFVYLSTDYIFAGSGHSPLKEEDEVGPKNVYGMSKVIGEEYIKAVCSQYFIIRTAWLYGEGKNFIKTILNLAERGNPLNIVGDQVGSPTYAKDLARSIVELMCTEDYGTYHITGSGSCSWYELAAKVLELKGISCQVNKVTSQEMIRKAKRPKYAVLDNSKLKKLGIESMRYWEDAVKEYLESMREE